MLAAKYCYCGAMLSKVTARQSHCPVRKHGQPEQISTVKSVTDRDRRVEMAGRWPFEMGITVRSRCQ